MELPQSIDTVRNWAELKRLKKERRIEMTEKEAIELFEKAHTIQEQWKLGSDIQDISDILNQRLVNMYQIRVKIEKVNEEHPENVLLFDLSSHLMGIACL